MFCAKCGSGKISIAIINATGYGQFTMRVCDNCGLQHSINPKTSILKLKRRMGEFFNLGEKGWRLRWYVSN